MDFYYYFLFAVSIWVLCATYSDLLKIRKSEYIEGKIVGYQFSGMSIWKGMLFEYYSRFWPVIEYNRDGKPQTFTAKKFSCFLPVGTEVKGRFYKEEPLRLYSPLAAYVYVSVVWLVIFIFDGERINTLFIILFAYFVFPGLGQYWLNRKLGKRHTFYRYQSLEKPENFSLFKEDDIKGIEAKDLVSYEQAHIHQYYTRKNKKVDLVSSALMFCLGILLFTGIWQEVRGN